MTVTGEPAAGFTIREANESDVGIIFQLIRELA
jgi:hypothetical protein